MEPQTVPPTGTSRVEEFLGPASEAVAVCVPAGTPSN
jgi:hypothetical protein